MTKPLTDMCPTAVEFRKKYRWDPKNKEIVPRQPKKSKKSTKNGDVRA